MAPVGNINAQIQIDQDSICGPNEKLTGHITLTFTPNKQSRGIGSITNGSTTSVEQEIFGPLQLHIVLQGNAKLKVLENRTSHAYILFYEIRRLFRKTRVVSEKPFRAQAEEPKSFPFSISFPESTDYYRGFCNILPPTFHDRFQTTAARQAGKHQGAAWVEYGLQVQVGMPGIEVEITRPPEQTIRYEQPYHRITPQQQSQGFEQRHVVQTYDLLPESTRPNGLFDRTRAALRNVAKPVFVFDAFCTALPTTIALGAYIKFDVRVRPDLEAMTAIEAPEIRLGTSGIEILSRTQLFATNEKGVDSPKLDYSAIIATLPISQVDGEQAFTKANDFIRSLSTTILPKHLPTSFRVIKLERSYRLRVVLRFNVAGSITVMKKELPLTILPPSTERTAMSGASGSAVAGPSSTASRPRLALPDDYDLEQLPVYEEAHRPAYEEVASSSAAT